MGFVASLLKQRKLRRISAELGSTTNVTQFINNLTSAKSSKEERALAELFRLCESDRQLREIMMAYGASQETLHGLYQMLVANGGGQWAGGHYVPVSALGYGFPLLFLLQNANSLPWSRICVLLIEYFERNDVGPVPLELRGPLDPNDPLHALWEIDRKRSGRE